VSSSNVNKARVGFVTRNGSSNRTFPYISISASTVCNILISSCSNFNLKSETLHVLSDLRFQTRAFGELFVKLRGQSSHLVSKGFVVIFAFFRANVSPRCQNIIVFL
jgi:hypothetical protein